MYACLTPVLLRNVEIETYVMHISSAPFIFLGYSSTLLNISGTYNTKTELKAMTLKFNSTCEGTRRPLCVRASNRAQVSSPKRRRRRYFFIPAASSLEASTNWPKVVPVFFLERLILLSCSMRDIFPTKSSTINNSDNTERAGARYLDIYLTLCDTKMSLEFLAQNYFARSWRE